MKPALSLTWICLLAAAWAVPGQAGEAHSRPTVLECSTLDRADSVQDPERPLQDSEPKWTEERALVDEAGAALERSDFGRARQRSARAIRALLSAAPSERGETWLALLELAAHYAWRAHDLPSARRASELVLEVRLETLPEDHPAIQTARISLAAVMKRTGDLAGARALEEQVIEVRSRTLPPDHSDLQAVRSNLSGTLMLLGDLHGARALQESVLEVFTRTLSAEHQELQAVQDNLALTLAKLGDQRGAGALYEELLEVRSRTLPADHPHIQRARQGLAYVRIALGDAEGARVLLEEILEAFSRTPPADPSSLRMARDSLAAVLSSLESAAAAEGSDQAESHELLAELAAARADQASGDHARARQRIVAAIERALPVLAGHQEPEHLCLCALGHFAQELGELGAAERFRSAVLEMNERTLAPDHPEIINARLNLGATRHSLGNYEEARALFEAVLIDAENTLPAEHPFRLAAQHSLAVTMMLAGDFSTARVLQEAVLQASQRSFPADHPNVLATRHNLAEILRTLGDLEGARAHQEAVLGVYEGTVSDDHPSVTSARHSLAVTMSELGDLNGAHALYEATLRAVERTLPEDDPRLLNARHSFAISLKQIGDLHGCHTLQRSVLETYERTLPEDHPKIIGARFSLAMTLRELGDLAGACEIAEDVLESWERSLRADHPTLNAPRLNLAVLYKELGDLEAARALEERVLDAYQRTLPDGHHLLQKARGNLAWTLARIDLASRTGEGGAANSGWERALDLTRDVARAQTQAVRGVLWSSSVREAGERAALESEKPLMNALSFAIGLGAFGSDAALLAEAFALSEAGRGAGLLSATLARCGGNQPEAERLRAEIRAASAELADLAGRSATPEEFQAARARRELAERELIRLAEDSLGDRSVILDVSFDRLAASLEVGQALVGYRRFTRRWLEVERAGGPGTEVGDPGRSRDELGAFVLTRGQGGEPPRLAFVELGPLDAVERAVLEWRAAIGVGAGERTRSGVGAGSGLRGIGLEPAAPSGGAREGADLRRLVWDPLVDALAGADGVVVALDDALHLVPLEALDLGDGQGLVGDRWRIEMRLALWELVDEPPAPVGSATLVSLGGASFHVPPLGLRSGEPATGESEPLEPEPTAGDPPTSSPRGTVFGGGFAPLPHTRTEARGLAALFVQTHGDGADCLVLEERSASRAALEEAAPSARWLHVATHGWFAPSSVRSWTEVGDDSRADALVPAAGAEQTVRGLSPLLLCGLALAGADLPADSRGRMPGLMTAEELSTLDLANCELAVLSACDTNRGELTRAGQGVASLQKALHMAGARSVITSLWKVPDEATSELMLDFYRRLWVENKPKHQALWEAKLRLRHARDERGEPLYTTRDWAAWVLTGEPD